MPKFEKLDNSGKPTGEYKVFTDRVAQRLMRIKNVKWRKVENDQPKISRETPLQLSVSIDSISTKRGQLEWVAGQNDEYLLEEALEKTQFNAVKKAIINKLQKPTDNDPI